MKEIPKEKMGKDEEENFKQKYEGNNLAFSSILLIFNDDFWQKKFSAMKKLNEQQRNRLENLEKKYYRAGVRK